MLQRRSALLAACACSFLVVAASAVDTGPGGAFIVGPNLNVDRAMSHAARLAGGEVAVFGGHGDGYEALDTAEILDPTATSGAWTQVRMVHAHDAPYFARLADGRFLIAGGASQVGASTYADAEIFDPVARTFVATDSCVAPRSGGTAATLADGRVLLVGAWNDLSAASSTGEVFDPADHADSATGTFSITGALSVPRAYPTVVPTPDGGALVIGGVHPVPGDARRLTSIEVWDAPSRVFQYGRDNLIPTESGWEPAPAYDAYRPVEEQRIFDGRYLFFATRTGPVATEQTLFTVDAATNAVELFPTTPDLPSAETAELVAAFVDASGETARLFLRDRSGSAPFERFQFATLTLRTGELDVPTGWFVPPGDHAPVSGGQSMAVGGRIVLAGGPDLSNTDGAHNSARTLVVGPPAPPLAPPEAPVAVTVEVAGAADVRISWTDASDRESGWHVERKAVLAADWSPLDDAAANATSQIDSGVARGPSFHYRVASFNAAGASAWVETTVPAAILAGKLTAAKRLALGTVKVGVARSKKLTVTNADKRAPLMVGLSGTTGPFSAALASPLVVPPRKRVTIVVSVLAPAKGRQSGALTLWTSDAAKPAYVVSLTAKAK